jgi:outer membrane biosynthesis protein TonB
MLARGALCRLAASKTSAHDLQLASFLQLALVSRNVARLPAVRALSRAYTSALGARRAYATTTSATKPTATVKRAVKAKAAEKTPPKTATRKKAATATATAAKTARKPRAAAATKAKLKPKPKAKKAPKKAAPKKRVKKVATPEEKEKAKITELRRKALREPVTSRALNAYSAFLGDRTRGKKAEAGTQISRVADLAQTWRALTPAEHEVRPILQFFVSGAIC